METKKGKKEYSRESLKHQFFELTFHKKHKDKVTDAFLPYMLARANAIKEEEKVVKLYSRHLCSYDDGDNSTWGSINLEHPAMAMDPELKKMIIKILDRFVRRREFYIEGGEGLEKGYLLYGPPGTGKSSLIAAMANYLKFDVYDLGLTNLSTDYKLKRVLLSTTNRSILVIEDIDCCSVDIQNRQSEKKKSNFEHQVGVTLGLIELHRWFVAELWRRENYCIQG